MNFSFHAPFNPFHSGTLEEKISVGFITYMTILETLFIKSLNMIFFHKNSLPRNQAALHLLCKGRRFSWAEAYCQVNSNFNGHATVKRTQKNQVLFIIYLFPFLQAAYEEMTEIKVAVIDLFKNVTQNIIISAPSMAQEYFLKKQVHCIKPRNSLQFTL